METNTSPSFCVFYSLVHISQITFLETPQSNAVSFCRKQELSEEAQGIKYIASCQERKDKKKKKKKVNNFIFRLFCVAIGDIVSKDTVKCRVLMASASTKYFILMLSKNVFMMEIMFLW